MEGEIGRGETGGLKRDVNDRKRGRIQERRKNTGKTERDEQRKKVQMEE